MELIRSVDKRFLRDASFIANLMRRIAIAFRASIQNTLKDSGYVTVKRNFLKKLKPHYGLC